MQTALKNYLPLFKLRICSLITFSAVVGLISTASANISITNILFLIIATMLASMSASCFNHYFDMDIDAVMKRTQTRPIPSGSIDGGRKTLLIATVLFIAAILVSFNALNYMVSLHLFLGALVYAVIYTAWLKRRSWSNIIIGGLAGSFAVLAGGASAAAELCLLPVLIGDSKTAKYILLNTILLVISSLLPSLFGYLGVIYTITAIGVGVFFIIRNLQLI